MIGSSAIRLFPFPLVHAAFDIPVIVVKLRFQQDERRQPPHHLRDLAYLIAGERTPQHIDIAIAEPLLDDLIAADGFLSAVFGVFSCQFSMYRMWGVFGWAIWFKIGAEC